MLDGSPGCRGTGAKAGALFCLAGDDELSSACIAAMFPYLFTCSVNFANCSEEGMRTLLIVPRFAMLFQDFEPGVLRREGSPLTFATKRLTPSVHRAPGNQPQGMKPFNLPLPSPNSMTARALLPALATNKNLPSTLS